MRRGQSGSASPGAAPQMNVRFRDWDTPKLPAFRTPKRTCACGQYSAEGSKVGDSRSYGGSIPPYRVLAGVVTSRRWTMDCEYALVLQVSSRAREKLGPGHGGQSTHLVAEIQQRAQREPKGEGLVVAHEIAHVLQQEVARPVEVSVRQVRHHLLHNLASWYVQHTRTLLTQKHALTQRGQCYVFIMFCVFDSCI